MLLNNFSKSKISQIALGFNSTIEWKRNDLDSFLFAYEMGYLSDCTTHMPYPYTAKFINPTVGDCYRDALLFDDEYIWREDSPLLHKRAFEHGWLTRCTEHMFNRIEKQDYDFEDCLRDSVQFINKKAWRKANTFQYQKAYIKGWVNKCFRKVNNWTVEKCFEDALQYKHKKDWRTSEASVMSIQLNCYELCTSHMTNPGIIWTEDTVIAKALEYSSSSEWEAKSSSSYGAARNLGVFNEASKHMHAHKNIIWSLERCIEISSSFTSKAEWRMNHKKSYYSALKNGFFTQCIEHYPQESNSKYTLEYCSQLSSKLNYKRDWRIEYYTAYRICKQNGWSDHVCAHMSDHKPKKSYTLEGCMNIAAKYLTLKEWELNDRPSYYIAFNKDWIARCLYVLNENNQAA